MLRRYLPCWLLFSPSSQFVFHWNCCKQARHASWTLLCMLFTGTSAHVALIAPPLVLPPPMGGGDHLGDHQKWVMGQTSS